MVQAFYYALKGGDRVKVYVLSGCISWETCSVLGVYKEEADANAALDEHEESNKDWETYHVDTYDLIE